MFTFQGNEFTEMMNEQDKLFFEKLNSPINIIFELILKIVVSENEPFNIDKFQKIKIQFKFIFWQNVVKKLLPIAND